MTHHCTMSARKSTALRMKMNVSWKRLMRMRSWNNQLSKKKKKMLLRIILFAILKTIMTTSTLCR